MTDKIWVKPIKNKKAPTIKKSLLSIFETINGPIQEIASDSGNVEWYDW